MGGETLAAENEVELEVLVVRSRPSCLMLSSTGWAAVTSFQSCWRSEGHTATHGENAAAISGRRGSPHWHPRTGLARDPTGPSLPGWHSSAPRSSDCALGNHSPKLGTALCAGTQGGKAAQPHREPQNKPPAASREPRRAVPAGRGPQPSAPPGRGSQGPALHPPQLKLAQAAPAIIATRPQTLNRQDQKSIGPAPSLARSSCSRRPPQRIPLQGPYLGAGSAGARRPGPGGGSPAPGAAGLTGAAAGAAASAGAAAGRPAACSLTAAGRQKGEIKACYFQPCSRNGAGRPGPAAGDARGGGTAAVCASVLLPGPVPAQLAAEPDGGFDLSEEEGKRRKGEGKNKALKREGVSRAVGLLRAEIQLCLRDGSWETVPVCQKMVITSPFLVGDRNQRSAGGRHPALPAPGSSTGAPSPATSTPRAGGRLPHPSPGAPALRPALN